MISKKIVAPIITFCVWNLIISAFGLVVASNIVLGIALISILCMLSQRMLDHFVKENESLEPLDSFAHVVTSIWILTWTYAFPVAFWAYLTATLVLNLYIYTRPKGTDT